MANGIILVANGGLVTHILSDCITVTVVIVWLICFLCGVVGFQSTLIVKYVIQYWNIWTLLEAGLTVMDGTCSSWIHDDVIKWKFFSALLALCAGNSPVTGEFPSQRPVTRSFDVFVFFICSWINAWVNNREAGDWRRHCAHYVVIVMMYARIVFKYNGPF